jgi:O-antigen/teichoic acid export membrane protein
MSLDFARLRNSAVVWYWAFNALRLGSYLLLLPILSRVLTEADFGFYWLLVSLVGAVPLLDLGFSTAVDRGLSYAMAGAKELRAQGIPSQQTDHAPNFELLWKLLHTTRTFYRYVSVGVLLVLGAWGTYVVNLRIHETSNPTYTWLAWWLTLVGAAFEMYSGWWNIYLRGLNKVLLCSRILTLAFGIKFLLSGMLLLNGWGLLSVPVATLAASFIQRNASRRYALRFLSMHPSSNPAKGEVFALLRTLWPNSWRVGVHCLSFYLTPHASTVLCTKILGLSATAQLGLSLQLMILLNGIATVWIQVKWPILGQHLARNQLDQVRQIVHSRMLLQGSTFILMAVIVVPFTPVLLDWLQTDKHTIPPLWFAILAAATLLEMHFNSWTTLISIGNRLPFLWHTVLTNLGAVVLSAVLLLNTSLGIGAFVLGPLILSAAYNYWRWPIEGARMLGTSWCRLMFSGSTPTSK